MPSRLCLGRFCLGRFCLGRFCLGRFCLGRFSAALLLVGCIFGTTAPAAAQGRLSEAAGGFSYRPPAGWHIRTFPGLKYKISYTTTANINVVDEVSAMPLDKYLQLSLVNMKQAYTVLHVLKQGPFATASGIQGDRTMIDGVVGEQHVHQVFYVFPASSRKIVVTASSLASAGGKYDAATDQSMKTFKLQ